MKLPYGFMLDGQGNIALDENKCEIVRQIYKSYLAGLSLASLSEMLAEKNIPSPRGKEKWTPAMLDKLLFNKKYIAVVGMEQYFAAQFEKDRRSRIDQNTGKRKAARYDSRNVLSGLLVCAECGRSYRRVQRASGEIVWRCANRVEHGNRICKSSPTVTEEEAIRFVCGTLGIPQLNPKMISDLLISIRVESTGTLMPEFQKYESSEMLFSYPSFM